MSALVWKSPVSCSDVPLASSCAVMAWSSAVIFPPAWLG